MKLVARSTESRPARVEVSIERMLTVTSSDSPLHTASMRMILTLGDAGPAKPGLVLVALLLVVTAGVFVVDAHQRVGDGVAVHGRANALVAKVAAVAAVEATLAGREGYGLLMTLDLTGLGGQVVLTPQVGTL